MPAFAPMRAVTFQGREHVRVEERAEPELRAPGDALVRVEVAGVCGSDLHIYHGRVSVEPGFTLGHEWVGTVVEAGPDSGRSPGDRVLGCFQTACGQCFFCRHGHHQKCERGGVFGHGSGLGNLQGAQAEMLRVPHARLSLRDVPEGIDDDAALFAGDVLATAVHGVAPAVHLGDSVAVIGAGPVGLCAIQVARAAGAAVVLALDTVADRLAIAARLGAVPVDIAADDPRTAARAVSAGRGLDVAVECAGRADAVDTALRLLRDCGTLCLVGVHAERAQVHLGLLWFKGIRVLAGQANAILGVDPALALLAGGRVDIGPLVDRHVSLDDAVEAYRAFANREVVKVVLRP